MSARKFITAAALAVCFISPALAGDGMLGVYLTENDGQGGALIEEVAPSSPAAEAGLRKGDRIISCGDRVIKSASQLIPVLVDGNAGQVLHLRVSRDGWEKNFKITLARRKAAPAKSETKAPPKARGFLGIYLRQNDAGQPVIDGVMDGSPAAKAGLKVGDRVTAVASRKVSDPSGLITAIGQYGAGDSVPLQVVRGDQQMTLTPVLGRRPAERTAPAAPVEPSRPAPPTKSGGRKPFIGIALVDDGGKGPLKVDDVQANSPAERFGMRPGDVILSANGKPLKTIEDFVGLMSKLNAGDTVLFKIERDGWKSDIRLTLGGRKD